MADFTLRDDGRPVATPAVVEADAVSLSPDAVRAALGWELKPQGLSRDGGISSRPVAASRDGGRRPTWFSAPPAASARRSAGGWPRAARG